MKNLKAIEKMYQIPELRQYTIIDDTERKRYERLAKYGYYWDGKKWTHKNNCHTC